MKIKFYISTGYVNGKREEYFTPEQLGYEEPEFLNMPEEKRDKILKELFDDWLSNFDMGFTVSEDD